MKLSARRSPGTEARYERIRELGRANWRTRDIAAELAISDSLVCAVLRDSGIVTVGTRLGPATTVDLARVMDGICATAVPEEVALRVVKAGWQQLDRERFADWDIQLADGMRELRCLRRKLRITKVGS